MRVHDLLWISTAADLGSASKPDWVSDALARCPVVVVRRADAPAGLVAVGVRGASRSQRYAALLIKKDVIGCETPESFAEQAPWSKTASALSQPLIETLELVRKAAYQVGLTWGPVGSVGYQLATGMLSTNSQSDLDVLVRCTGSLNSSHLKQFYAAIRATPVCVDVVLESSDGAVALADYMQNSKAMVKTIAGPRLAHFSW